MAQLELCRRGVEVSRADCLGGHDASESFGGKLLKEPIVRTERRVRRWRSVAEKRQIVELSLEPGASVALVARAHGVNANQVFKWRRAFERGYGMSPRISGVPNTTCRWNACWS